jgi:hypothetical protein
MTNGRYYNDIFYAERKAGGDSISTHLNTVRINSPLTYAKIVDETIKSFASKNNEVFEEKEYLFGQISLKLSYSSDGTFYKQHNECIIIDKSFTLYNYTNTVSEIYIAILPKSLRNKTGGTKTSSLSYAIGVVADTIEIICRRSKQTGSLVDHLEFEGGENTEMRKKNIHKFCTFHCY